VFRNVHGDRLEVGSFDSSQKKVERKIMPFKEVMKCDSKRESTFDHKCKRLLKFAEKEGRLPEQKHSTTHLPKEQRSNEDEEELSLCYWIGSQKQVLENDTFRGRQSLRLQDDIKAS